MMSLIWGMTACESPTVGSQLPAPDRSCFDEEVYPVLIADCGYVGCHGNVERPFRVYGLGGTRLNTMSGDQTEVEQTATYERARSMLANAARPSESLLLRKPLETIVGGAAHGGIDAFGRDVYLNRDETNYQTLATWARGERVNCQAPTPDGGG